MIGLRHGRGYLGAERIAIEARSLRDVPDRDRYMIEPSDVHFASFL
jgi:hypothetical protein